MTTATEYLSNAMYGENAPIEVLYTYFNVCVLTARPTQLCIVRAFNRRTANVPAASAEAKMRREVDELRAAGLLRVVND